MKYFITFTSIILGVVLFLETSTSADSTAKHPELDQSAVKEAVAVLDQVANKAELNDVELVQLANQAIEHLGDEHYATNMLKESLIAGTSEEVLRAEILKVHESLTFRPKMEADVPKEFPSFTPLNHIEIKEYPLYRLARVQMSNKNGSRENSAFFSLFNHIKRNGIAMTAPVQVEYSKTDNSQEDSMAFLYGNTEIGALGRDSANTNVTVIDMPEQLVVSIGVRGGMSESAVEKAHQKLKKWLADNEEKYSSNGPLRKMGYNSPFVSWQQRYFEVQIPVTKVSSSN